MKLRGLTALVGAICLSTSIFAGQDFSDKDYFPKMPKVIPDGRGEVVSEEKPYSREVHKRYLEESDSPLHKTQAYREYTEKVENWEKGFIFSPLRGWNSQTERDSLALTAIEDMRLLKAVDEVPTEKVREEYLPTKHLLNELEEIDNGDLSLNKKIEAMYECISEKIKTGKSLPTTPTRFASITYRGKKYPIPMGRNILEMLEIGGEGNCKDISAAYFAIFNYHGIETKFRINAQNEEGKEKREGIEVGHSWIHVKTEEGFWIDLDPTRYQQNFVPLQSPDETPVFSIDNEKLYIRKQKGTKD